MEADMALISLAGNSRGGMRCTWGNSSLPITSEISVSSDSNRLEHASCSLLHYYCNNYCILLHTIDYYCTILHYIALLQYVLTCFGKFWESLTGSGHLWTSAPLLGISTGQRAPRRARWALAWAKAAARPSTMRRNHAQHGHGMPWTQWTHGHQKDAERFKKSIAFWSFWSFCIAMHCTWLLGFASRWTHRKAMNLSGHSLQRYEAKQIWLARLCSVPNFDRGWLEMVLHNHSFTLFTSYRQPNATVNECEWAMCNSCLATSITFFLITSVLCPARYLGPELTDFRLHAMHGDLLLAGGVSTPALKTLWSCRYCQPHRKKLGKNGKEWWLYVSCDTKVHGTVPASLVCHPRQVKLSSSGLMIDHDSNPKAEKHRIDHDTSIQNHSECL